MLTMSLDYHFWIAPLVLSDVNLMAHKIIDLDSHLPTMEKNHELLKTLIFKLCHKLIRACTIPGC
jgi:hypothetical protein